MHDGGGEGDLHPPRFAVHLDIFDGPFDLLLQLIAKHELDVTVVALSAVTDEFLAFLRASDAFDLGEASEFVVVAATLLDLKAARLLPAGEVDDEGDLAALTARDLLFARLLQYRAFKDIAALLADRMQTEAARFCRAVPLEERFTDLERPVSIGLDPGGLAALASAALAPAEPARVPVDHLHLPTVSVAEQAVLLARRLRWSPGATLAALSADCASRIEVVARFLAVLELYREGSVAVEQVEAFADVHLSWVGAGARGQHRHSLESGAAGPRRPGESTGRQATPGQPREFELR